MTFSFEKSMQVLSRTPWVLISQLHGLSDDWALGNEGPNTWSPRDVMVHLIHCEKTDWIPRMDIILSGGDKRFKPFDPSGNKTDDPLPKLLQEFKELRDSSIKYVLSKELKDTDMQKTGIHPAFGEVTLAQLLATWTVHDLNHISQVSRVMAKQYKAEVGPWIEYLRILKS